jgi:hypothetical protein
VISKSIDKVVSRLLGGELQYESNSRGFNYHINLFADEALGILGEYNSEYVDKASKIVDALYEGKKGARGQYCYSIKDEDK